MSWKTPITLASLTDQVHREGLGARDLVGLIEDRDREVAEAFCGKLYAPVSPRYRRAGMRTRTLGTRFGLVTIRVTQVRDNELGRTWFPIWDDIQIDRLCTYQADVIQIGIDFAQRMPYRNSVSELKKMVPTVMSARTLQRHVVEQGARLNRELRARIITTEAILADGTKIRKSGEHHHDFHLTMGVSQDGVSQVRCITVGEDWQRHRSALKDTRFSDPHGYAAAPKIATDLERGLADVLALDGSFWQPCQIHVVRAVGLSLWGDKVAHGPEKNAIVASVRNLLTHLRNSVVVHLPRGEVEAVEHRIAQTRKEFRRLATRLAEKGHRKTPRLLRHICLTVTTFASLAVQGQWMPWNTNRIERIMGEVSKRCKHRGMRWSAKGSQALLTLLVFRFVEPRAYQAHQARLLYGSENLMFDHGIHATVTRIQAEC